jgi:hypothetical protein
MEKTTTYVTSSQLYKLLGVFGLLLALVLFAAAAGAWKGYDFATEQVKNQLTQEKIKFPPVGSPALNPQEYPGLQQYGGQPVDSGIKAKAYADEFIWVHMMKASGGKTYAEVSEEARLNPDDEKLASLKNTLFQGSMLRSSLLTAYAFSVFGMLAGYAYPALLVSAGLLTIISIWVLVKSRR